MLLHCYAVVPNDDERNKLLSKLRHHNLPFSEQRCKVSIDTHFLTYKSVEKVMGYFEEIESLERGFSVVGDKSEVPYDSG